MGSRARMFLVLLAGLITRDVSVAATLTFEDRVDARRAIVEIYAHHRSPSAPVAVPGRILEDQVRRSLQLSVALERDWNLRLTADLMKRELDRIVRNTRDPQRLEALFVALDHDPLLIQEVLIRPALAERLARRSFERDPRTKGGAGWDDWWARNAPALDHDEFVIPVPTAAAVPTKTTTCAIGEGWDSGVLDGVEPVMRYGQPLVWTGSELLLWGGAEGQWDGGEILGDGYRYDPVLELWSPISAVGGPGPRFNHEAVWTGGEMIVWGGFDGIAETNTGFRYDPIADSWAPMSMTGAPQVRSDAAVVWTGTEMIVWGGRSSQGQTLGDGSRYDPQLDSWTPVSIVGAPTARSLHTGVWSGSEFIVWGGGPLSNTYVNTGGRYDPSTDSWSPVTTFHAPAARKRHVAAWADGEMIVFGGSGDQNERSGARYDPAADSWTPIAAAPSTLDSLISPGPAWTGTAFIAELQSSGLTAYSPTTNSWSDLPCLMRGQPVWSGTELLVWGDSLFADIDEIGWKYDPQAAACYPMVTPPDGPEGRRDHTAVWTGAEMIVWGGRRTSYGALNDGKRYDPALDAWSAISSVNAPSERRDHSAVWTGSAMIVWGGEPAGPGNAGGRYDPLTDAWLPTSTVGAPFGRSEHSAVWTGSEMLVWGGDLAFPMGDGGRYDPASDSWLSMSTAGEPSPRAQHTAVWTGTEMIVWGGSQADSSNTGGRYEPIGDSWSATTLLGAPQERFGHTAIWTGDEMIVWGGSFNLAEELADGSRYDPAADSWSPVLLDGGPAARFWHSAVWNGLSMMVWGGRTLTPVGGDATLFADGATYDPVSDSWTAIEASGAPPARYGQSAVWAGDAMVVWGGAYSEGQNASFEKTGGRYVYSPDDDGDGVGAACDCAPEDSGVSAVPGEIGGVVVLGDKATLMWESDALNSGSGTLYQVLRGQVEELPVGGGGEGCLEPGTVSTSFVDVGEPSAGSAFFYLVRGVNVCSAGTYGVDTIGQLRNSGVCP